MPSSGKVILATLYDCTSLKGLCRKLPNFQHFSVFEIFPGDQFLDSTDIEFKTKHKAIPTPQNLGENPTAKAGQQAGEAEPAGSALEPPG